MQKEIINIICGFDTARVKIKITNSIIKERKNTRVLSTLHHRK